MLDWLIGSSRPADAYEYRGDNDEPYLEEPPDTPAPLFAVRAFKSALFGTPHPDLKSTNNSPVSLDNHSQKDQSASYAEDSKIFTSVNTAVEGSAINPKVDSLVSPTKGILLTPGTATTRRKNVSFGGLALNESKEMEKPNENKLNGKTNSDSQQNSSIIDFPPVNQRRQTNLTKALYKARIDGSKTNLDKYPGKEEPEREFTVVQAEKDDSKTMPRNQEPVVDTAVDITVDLNEPFSRSGQHWKAEFERYHKKSDREMKKIIRLGQNVRSYASKKDMEVSDLDEKLQRELSKVATMEANVTRLAAQLASTRRDNPKGTSEQARLVDDLAKQTTLAVRYKQKADRYKEALEKQDNAAHILESSKIGDTATPNFEEIPFQTTADFYQSHGPARELDSLRTELENFRNSAQRAERKVARLETENLALQKTIIRLKEEMELNETKRIAREENTRKRDENLRASKAESDTRLLKLTSDYEKLVLRVEQQNPSQGNMHHHEPLQPTPKHRQPQSHVDIWTQGDMDHTTSPKRSTGDRPTHPAHPANENKRPSTILKEIDQNLVPETTPRSSPLAPLKPSNLLSDDLRIPSSSPFPHPHPYPPHKLKSPSSSTTTRMRHRRSIIPSPRPLMLTFPSSAQKPLPSAPSLKLPPAPSFNPPSIPNTDLISLAATKPHVLGAGAGAGRRGMGLPDERVAAAKARLLVRRENKRGRGVGRE